MAEEVEAVGGDLLQSAFEQAALLPFDANEGAETLGHLTHPRHFGGVAWDAAADLDDYDGASKVEQVAGEGGPLDYTLTAEVDYVRKTGSTEWTESPGHSRTWAKRVRITATGPLGFRAVVERVFIAGGL